MANLLGELVSSVIEMPRWFAEVATVDPLSALLLLLGAVLVGFSVAFVGFLALGAVASLLTPELETGPRRTG